LYSPFDGENDVTGMMRDVEREYARAYMEST
jgi:hypothetical protein